MWLQAGGVFSMRLQLIQQKRGGEMRTLCSLESFTPQHTLLLETLCFLEHFAPRNSLLPGTVCFLEQFACLITRKTVLSFGEKCSRKQSVPGSKVFQGAKCFRKQSVLRRKVF